MLTSNDLHMSLQQQGLFGSLLPHDQQQVSFVSEDQLHIPILMFPKGYLESNFGSAISQVILRLLANILIGSKACILLPNTICINLNHNLWLVYFYKANVEIAASLDPITNRLVQLLDFIVIKLGISKYWPRGGHSRSATEYSFCKWNLSSNSLSRELTYICF